MPATGALPRKPGDFSNECIFIARIQEEDGTSSSVDVQAIDFSPPAEASPDWGHVQAHNRQDMQRSIQGLVIGSAYGSDNMGNGNYNTNKNHDGSNSTSTGRSPDTNSNRPTPSSTTASDSLGQNRQPNNQSNSSYESSPAASTHLNQQLPKHPTNANSYFTTNADYNTTSTGLTPDNGNGNGAFGLPETPGGTFEVPAGWEQQGTAMTPIGEGVFRHLMGLGPMEDPMFVHPLSFLLIKTSPEC